MLTVSRQVTNFVRACEALHWRFIDGDSLTIEDRDAIAQAAIDLLIRMETSTEANPCGSRPLLNVANKALESGS